MSACPDTLLLLHGLVDGELDAANSIAVETHLKSCAGCTAELARIEAVRGMIAGAPLRHDAPGALRRLIENEIDLAAAPSRSSGGARAVRSSPERLRPASGAATIGFAGRWASGGALLGIAASLLLVLAMPQLTTTGTQDQLVASHVRSLLANHLIDVATSNRHVVKPWFNGKIDFAPPVVDLADQGFPLVGGRLDYIDGHVVAAIVYHRRLHSINLFVRPAGALQLPIGITTHRDGYSLVRWTQGGLEFWAVSDVDTGDLQLFHRDFAARAGA